MTTTSPTITPEFRVSVARDVLERIAPEVRPEVNTYVKRDFHTGRVCAACACGQLFLSLVAPEFLGETELDGANIHERYLQMLTDGPAGADMELSGIVPVLELAFSREQLGLIEAAFMAEFAGKWGNPVLRDRGTLESHASYLDSYYDLSEIEEDLGPEAFATYRRFLSACDYAKFDMPAERLEHIMKNIIKNGGEFIP